MSNVFNENMTDLQATATYWREYDGKSEEEREKLMEEYLEVSRIITKRETRLAMEGWMC